MTAECTVCLNTGPVLMPVRYAIVPDAVSQTLPLWAAQPAAAFPSLSGYHYALRCMRQGFIYVYYDTGAQDLWDWEAWSVDEKGNLYRASGAPGARAIFNPPPCGRPIHQASNLEHMALGENALRYETWVAFSHARWTEETIAHYTRDPAARAQRMQNIHPAEWSTPGATFDGGVNRASEDTLHAVLDYRPTLSGSPKYPLRDGDDPFYQVSYIENGEYHFFEESVRPHTTFHPWVRNRREEGAAGRTLRAMQSRSLGPGGKAVSPLIIALHDPVGITHELTSWCDGLGLAHQSYLDELSVEFATWRNINGVKSQFEKTAAERFDTGVTLQGTTPRGDYPAINGAYQTEAGTKALRNITVARSWEKYARKLDEAKLNQFMAAYEQLCRALDTQMTGLVALRLDWLQDGRFIQCLDDHGTTLPDDNLNYREIVGYAVASINITPAGRRQVQRWINAYSTAKDNLFWRSQFFNDPALMQEMSPLLAKMKAESEKKNQPGKSDAASTQTALNSLMGALSKYGQSCDRALDALAKDSQTANVSQVRKILAAGDRRLTTFTGEVFSRTVLGPNLDSANELFYKWLFARDAGVEEKAIRALISSQLDSGPQGATAFRLKMAAMFRENANINLKQDIANKYSDSFNKMINSMEGKRHIDVSRIKLLGVFLNMWEFTSQLDEVKKGSGSASGLLSSALFTASAGIQMVLPAYETMAEVTKDKNLELLGYRTEQGGRLSKWILRANVCGSLAAGLAVVNDLEALGASFEKDGAKRWQAVGLASLKVISDSAFAIQSSEELLGLLGKKGVINALTRSAGNASLTFGKNFLANAALRGITILASWQVMILVALAPAIVASFVDDELQDWCEQCVFGSKSEVENTEGLSVEVRAEISQQQEDKLIKALHEVLGLPLPERLQKDK